MSTAVQLGPEEKKAYEALGAAIRRARSEVGMTQTDLGKYLGLTRSSIANMEAGRQRVSAYTLLRCHQLLGVVFPALPPLPLDRLHEIAKLGEAADERRRLQRRITRAVEYLYGRYEDVR